MEYQTPKSLPDAHQQVRLGDLQASAQKWTAAIEYYSRAIKYFQSIQDSLQDVNLKPIIQAQILQCEKGIHFYRLKHNSEQATNVERSSRMTRAHSIGDIKPPKKSAPPLPRRNTMQLKNTGEFDGTDSLTAMMFPNRHRNTAKNSSLIMTKKTKNDSQKMEELQISYKVSKDNLKSALDDNAKLRDEIDELRAQKEVSYPHQPVVFRLLSTNQEDENEEENESDNELEATI